MKALLLIALVSGQVYEWVDSNGDSHFTDDVSTIPRGVKRRTFEGAEPVLTVTREKKSDAGVATKTDGGVAQKAVPPAGPNACERAQQRIASLELAAAEAKSTQDEKEAKAGEACASALALRGEPGYALCMAQREARSNPTRAKADADRLAKELEVAREELRRVQVGGCR